MTKKKRLGFDPTEQRKAQIREAVRIEKPGRSEAGKLDSPGARESGLQEVERSRLLQQKNFYENKKGELIQKVTLHLPFEMVERFKIKALKSRKTLSEIIREKLKS